MTVKIHSIAWPFSRRVRPAYPVLIIHLTFVQSPACGRRQRPGRRARDEDCAIRLLMPASDACRPRSPEPAVLLCGGGPCGRRQRPGRRARDEDCAIRLLMPASDACRPRSPEPAVLLCGGGPCGRRQRPGRRARDEDCAIRLLMPASDACRPRSPEPAVLLCPSAPVGTSGSVVLGQEMERRRLCCREGFDLAQIKRHGGSPSEPFQ